MDFSGIVSQVHPSGYETRKSTSGLRQKKDRRDCSVPREISLDSKRLVSVSYVETRHSDSSCSMPMDLELNSLPYVFRWNSPRRLSSTRFKLFQIRTWRLCRKSSTHFRALRLSRKFLMGCNEWCNGRHLGCDSAPRQSRTEESS